MGRATKGTIAAGHPETAQAAIMAFREGGNAFDAAVAALWASFVTEPCMSSAGGGGFATIYTKDRQACVLDFFCQTPYQKGSIPNLDFEPVEVDFGSTTEVFYTGLGAIAVPGAVAGIFSMHRRYGSIPMHILVEPAIKLAKEGWAMNAFQHYDIGLLRPILERNAESRALFYPNQRDIAIGETFKMPGFADYLYDLAREGSRAFYEGEAGQKLVRSCQESGGFLTMRDLANYRVEERKILQIPYRNKYILTNPLPSAGGALMAAFFGRLGEMEISYDAFSKKQVHCLQHHLREVFEIQRTIPNLEELTSKWGSTTHMSIVDEYENAISITTSNGEGSGYIIPNTNIMLNNMLGETALLPDGLHSWIENTRLSSMMSPTIVLDERKKVELVLGTGGASRIPSAIAQVLHYYIDLNISAPSAVVADRLHHEHKELNLEPKLVGKHFREDGVTVVDWPQKSMFFGGVHTVARQKDNWLGIGDDRRDGVGLQL